MGKITKDDSIVIKGLREAKQWSSRRLIREFPQKAWSRASLDRLLSKIDATGVTERDVEAVVVDGRLRRHKTSLRLQIYVLVIIVQHSPDGATE